MGMRIETNIDVDNRWVTLALFEDNNKLGWIGYTAEQCDEFLRIVGKYRAALDKISAPSNGNGKGDHEDLGKN